MIMSNANPINGVPFGKEKTPAQCRARADWERQKARELSASSPELAIGHRETARAYDALARDKEKPSGKSPVPGVTKWIMSAGGTSAAEGKHGYTLALGEGTYHIWPISRNGRHVGYGLKFSATGNQPLGGHGGLWHDLGTHSSPAKAAAAARAHYARSF